MKSHALVVAVLAFAFIYVSAGYAQQSAEQLYQSALYEEEIKGELNDAIKIYEMIINKYPGNRSVAAKALLHIGLCNEKLGKQEAQKAYQRLIEEYPGQKEEVAIAKERLARLTRALEEVSHKPTFRKIRIPTKVTWDAKLSPNGKKVTLATDDKLWIMPLSGKLGPDFPGAPVKLNTGDVEVSRFGLAWSADGRWIAFNGNIEEKLEDKMGISGIYVVPVQGGKPKKVYENYRDARVVNYRISLSPHGKTLAFSSVEGKKQHIYTISTDGGVPKQLVNALAREPVFSPDGKMIAYVEDENLGRAGGGLWVVPAQGGTAKLVANAGMASSPIWSPDGNMIAFIDYKVGQICIIPIGEDVGAAGEMVTIDPPEGIKEVWLLAGWTPDNKIGAIFRSNKEFALYTLPAKGGKAALVTHGEYPVQPRWSPDGKRIFHTNKADEGSGAWKDLAISFVPAEGGKVTTVPIQSDAKIIIPPWGGGNRVSPDGKTIVFSGKTQEDSVMHIWTLPVNGGKPKQLTKAPSPITDMFPCWSPDGKSIAFVRARKSKNYFKLYSETNIYIVRVNGGEPKSLTSESDNIAMSSIAWSPDGKLMAFFTVAEVTSGDAALKVIPINGGKSRVVANVKKTHVNKEMAWSPDSKKIAVNGPKEKVIKIISLNDGSIVDIETDLVDTKIYHLDWSPDGDRLVFGGWQGGGPELWVMENFLPEEEDDKAFNIRKVWEGPLLGDLWGEPSPDGRYLSYVDWETGDLAIYEIATGKKRRLTNKGSWDESGEFAQCSRWSPDGKHIVYDWYNENDFCDLRIIGLYGSKPRILYSNEEVVWTAACDWSPDGKQILVCFEGKYRTNQMVLVSTADGSVRVLKTLNKYNSNMSFSPDGRYIVYDFPPKEDSPDHDIYLMSTDGSREIPLVEHPAHDFVLGWAPDGENILFASDRTGTLGAWLIAVADGKPQGVPELVKPDIGRFQPMGFTQKGSFYYGIEKGSDDVYIAELDPETGKILVPPKKAIKRFEGSNIASDYSPDGKYLAYIRRIRRSNVLCIRSLETGKEREFSLNLNSIFRVWRPRWSPDCRFIIVSVEDNKDGYGIYKIDVQTGDFTPIVMSGSKGSIYLVFGECSHDGKAIFYMRSDWKAKILQILVRDLETGTEKELYRSSSSILNISLSPDGQWLALRYRSKSLKVMSVTGGEPRELYRSDKISKTITWTADGKYILFAIEEPGQNRWDLCRIPAEGGEPEKFGLGMIRISNLRVHPDGRHIAFSSSGSTPEFGEVWVMGNFLPE